MGSSRTRARTHVPCIGRQILNHCATREVPISDFKGFILSNSVTSIFPDSCYIPLTSSYMDVMFKTNFDGQNLGDAEIVFLLSTVKMIDISLCLHLLFNSYFFSFSSSSQFFYSHLPYWFGNFPCYVYYFRCWNFTLLGLIVHGLPECTLLITNDPWKVPLNCLGSRKNIQGFFFSIMCSQQLSLLFSEVRLSSFSLPHPSLFLSWL